MEENTIVFQIDKIIWGNEDGAKGKKVTKWKLMRCEAVVDDSWPKLFLKDKGKSVPFLLTGEVGKPDYASQRFDGTGQWKYDSQKNQFTFAASFITAHFPEPEDEEGVIDFIRHAGARISLKVATAIVKKFGYDLRMIAQMPDVVAAQIKGISYKSACKLASKVELLETTSILLEELKQSGVSYNDIVKIAREYGTDSLDVVRSNPYQMRVVIGFVNCDKIALSQGWKHDDPLRLTGAVWSHYGLMKGKRSSIMVPIDELKVETLKGLNRIEEKVSEETLAEHIEKMIASHVAVRNSLGTPDGKKKEFFYAKEDYVCERNLAQGLMKIARAGTSERDKSVSDFVSYAEDWVDKGLNLSGKQKEAVINVAKNSVSVITGGPGTGKTTCLKAIIDCYSQAYPDSPIVLMAPTGLASKRMSDATGRQAHTVHKALGLVPKAHGFSGFSQEGDTEDLSGLIIVDESSMLGMFVAEFLVDTVIYTNATRIVFVGDVDQLPPVSQGTFFEDIINSGTIPVTRLDRNFRQEAGSTIIDDAYAINAGNTEGLKYANDFVFIPEKEADIASQIKKQFEESMNAFGLAQTFVLSPTRKAGPLCTNVLNPMLQELANPERPGRPFIKRGSTTFRCGDRVMCMKNYLDKDVVNGDIGYIADIRVGDSGDNELLIEFDTHTVTFEFDKLENLELAYAITVHKSQGCEFNSIIIPASFSQKVMLYRNLLYTAVTRAKKKVTIVGQRSAINLAIKNTPPKIEKSLLCLRLRKLSSNA